MPFRSEAQRRLFAHKVAENQMPQATFDEWNAATKGPLKERVRKKQATTARPKRKGRRK